MFVILNKQRTGLFDYRTIHRSIVTYLLWIIVKVYFYIQISYFSYLSLVQWSTLQNKSVFVLKFIQKLGNSQMWRSSFPCKDMTFPHSEILNGRYDRTTVQNKFGDNYNNEFFFVSSNSYQDNMSLFSRFRRQLR